jgi:hypothetical protein
MAAGTIASTAMYFATPLALILVYKGAIRHAQAREAADLYAHPDLPSRARRAVERASEQLPPGEARMLLAGVVTQAVLLYQAQENSVGTTSRDREMLDDAAELVESACASAEQLALLDAATGSWRTADAGSRAARQKFTASLSSAATVIRNLHVAIVSGGTVASDRVAEITTDLRAETDARARAIAELTALLEERRQGATRPAPFRVGSTFQRPP